MTHDYFPNLYCYELNGDSAIAAKILMTISEQNVHHTHPFSEENCSLPYADIADLLRSSGLNRHVWYQGNNVAPVLFRRAGADIDNDPHYYLLTPIDNEAPEDIQLNAPKFGTLLSDEQKKELLLDTFGAGGLHIDFGIGPQIISDNVQQKLILLLPEQLKTNPLDNIPMPGK